MKKTQYIILLLIAIMCTFLSACNQEKKEKKSSPTAKCHNGIMVGQKEKDNVISYLGVPYAKAPVGDLRWKAPVAAEESDKEVPCHEFGDTPLQYEWPTEPASYAKKSEDCLSLNIWTSAVSSKKPKTVMVFFHGGAYSWGGTTDEMYNGHNFVKDNKDVIVVTCNYRLGLMGWADFSQVPGGEEYTDINMGLRDQICALQWIQDNIADFGGDPHNVTVFGESAGGFCIGGLLYSPKAEGLFQHAILESGVFLPKDRQDAVDYANYIMEASGCKTMEELKAISAEEWMKIDSEEWIGDEVCGIVCDGDVIPLQKDMEAALQAKVDQGVDILLGTNAEEWNYFGEDAEGETPEEKFESWTADLNANWKEYYNATDQKGKAFMKEFYKNKAAQIPEKYAADKKIKDALVKSYLITESWRMDHIRFADKYADLSGNVYMYYWNVPSTKEEYYESPCHAVELAYVFNNLEDGIYAGEVDPLTAVKTQNAWVNFAQSGDPSNQDISWKKYDSKTRDTMIINKENWEIQSDPDGEFREGLDHIGATLPW